MIALGTITFWHWWGVAGLLALLALAGPRSFVLWIAAAAALVGLALTAWQDMPLALQVLMFAALALANLLAWSRLRGAVRAGASRDELERGTI